MSAFIVHPIIRALILLSVLAAVVFSTLDGFGLKERISNVVFETYISLKPREPSERLVFVDIDDQSLANSEQWPWPRTRVAEMLRNIKNAGAEVIIFDGVLAEPDRTSPDNVARFLEDDNPLKQELMAKKSHDAILAETIDEIGNFVAGFTHGSNTKPPMKKRRILVKRPVKDFFLSQKTFQDGYFQTTAQFLPELQDAAAGNGSFMASGDDSGVIRRTGLMFHNGKELFPSLIFEGLRIYANDGKEFIKISENPEYNNFQIAEPFIVYVGDYEIPMGPDGKMWVYFRQFDRNEDVSAYRFFDAQFSKNPIDLTGKIVFIASSAEGLMDLRATPFGMQPGVRVHMNAMEQILENQFLIRPYTANLLEIGVAIGVCLLLIVLSYFFNPLWLAVITITVSGGMFWLAWVLFASQGGLFDPVTPSIMMVILFLATSILNYLKTEQERRQVRDAFGLYISPDFMKELTSNPDKLQLGGEIKDLSVLFSDIRSFTTISEGLTPTELIQLMNDFLTPMSDLVMQNRGTIDKYMGDAMMAFWNAPLDDEHHARNACTAALQMNDALVPINEEIKKKAEGTGKEPVLLNAGIGINTGPCAVGNMGSKQRFAYSTLGDAVNLASRLEGQTKNYGVNILIGEETVRQAPGFATLEMDLIQVKGKTEPARIYALLGDPDMAGSKEFQEWEKAHKAMIAAYQGGEFEEAQKLVKVARDKSCMDLSLAYEMYEKRISALIKTPPEGEWDGVFVATSK